MCSRTSRPRLSLERPEWLPPRAPACLPFPQAWQTEGHSDIPRAYFQQLVSREPLSAPRAGPRVGLLGPRLLRTMLRPGGRDRLCPFPEGLCPPGPRWEEGSSPPLQGAAERWDTTASCSLPLPASLGSTVRPDGVPQSPTPASLQLSMVPGISASWSQSPGKVASNSSLTSPAARPVHHP